LLLRHKRDFFRLFSFLFSDTNELGGPILLSPFQCGLYPPFAFVAVLSRLIFLFDYGGGERSSSCKILSARPPPPLRICSTALLISSPIEFRFPLPSPPSPYSITLCQFFFPCLLDPPAPQENFFLGLAIRQTSCGSLGPLLFTSLRPPFLSTLRGGKKNRFPPGTRTPSTPVFLASTGRRY